MGLNDDPSLPDLLREHIKDSAKFREDTITQFIKLDGRLEAMQVELTQNTRTCDDIRALQTTARVGGTALRWAGYAAAAVTAVVILWNTVFSHKSPSIGPQ